MNFNCKLFKTPISLGLLAYSVILFITSLIEGNSILGISGIVAASIFYAKRVLDEESVGYLKKIYTVFGGVAAVVGVIVAICKSNYSLWNGPILDSVLGGACIIAMVVFCCGKKTDFIKTVDNTVFWIIMAVTVIVLPCILMLLTGIVALIVGLVFFVIAMIFIGVGGIAVLGTLGSGSSAPTLPQFRDDHGGIHTNAYDRDKANEKIKANKENSQW